MIQRCNLLQSVPGNIYSLLLSQSFKVNLVFQNTPPVATFVIKKAHSVK